LNQAFDNVRVSTEQFLLAPFCDLSFDMFTHDDEFTKWLESLVEIVKLGVQ
jgi:hypothetical protein